jgi:hypothetical protein
LARALGLGKVIRYRLGAALDFKHQCATDFGSLFMIGKRGSRSTGSRRRAR